MSTKLPRLNVVLEKPLYEELRKAARKDGLSVSAKARDLIRDALEVMEDSYLSRLAESRLKSSKGRTLSHKEIWGRTKG